MEFFLPDQFDPHDDVARRGLHAQKETFLEQYARLEKQRFLHCMALEFKGQPALQEISVSTYEDGKEFDVDLKFAPGFDAEEDEGYHEAKAIQHSLMAAYAPELAVFCKDRTISRSMLFADDGSPRFASTRDLLTDIELADFSR